VDPRIIPGAWITVRNMDAVVTDTTEEWVRYRYPSRRCVYKDGEMVGLEEKTIWVANSDPKADVTFLREADEVSRHVLTLEGPYGEGEVLPHRPPPLPPVGPLRETRASWEEASEVASAVYIEGIMGAPDFRDYHENEASKAIFKEWDAWREAVLAVHMAAIGWTVDEYRAASDADMEAYIASLRSSNEP
jgi:hypothetical protein